MRGSRNDTRGSNSADQRTDETDEEDQDHIAGALQRRESPRGAVQMADGTIIAL